jgi:hypothetical protein
MDEMLVLDYIIANQDRHFGNFGFIRDVNTLEFLDFAPIFDCGTSLRYDTPTKYIDISLDVESQPFLDTHSQQITLINDWSKFDLSKLGNISNWIHNFLTSGVNSIFIDEERSEKLATLVERRIDTLKQ